MTSNAIYGLKLIDAGIYLRTAYCKCPDCCGKWSKYKKTAFGYIPKQGRTIAVDPTQFNRGEIVIIEFEDGHIECRRCEDTGRLIKGNRIDDYKRSHKDVYLIKDSVKIWRINKENV